MPIDLPKKHEGERIDSWKEIAAYFDRDERTVKRWEKERGLPVYRVPGGGRGTVFAYTEELTAWLRSSQPREVSESLDSFKADETADVETAVEPSAAALETVAAEPVRGTPRRPKGVWLAAAAFVLIALLLTGFPRFFQLRSVQGHILPAVARRTSLAPHKEAEDLYLEGRYHWNKRTPEGLTEALDDFTKAAASDPNYALAYAGQADCYNLLREYTRMPASQAFPLAIAAATKSVALDDRLPEGHRALGFAYFFWNWDLAGGEREFRRAIALNPNDVEAHHWYATTLVSAARYSEAVAEIEKARHLDPMSNSVAADRAVILGAAGRQDESIEILLELEKSEPNFLSPYVYLSAEYFDRKEYLKYFDQSEVAAKLSHDPKAFAEVQVSRKLFQQGGERTMLEGMLASEIEGFRQGNTEALTVARSYALLGKNKEAMDYLERSYQRHEFELITALDWDGFRGLRSYPEYQDIVKRLGLKIAGTA